jgi:hypothetical protein
MRSCEEFSLIRRYRVMCRESYLWVQTAPLLADLFLYSYEADFIQGLLKKNEKKLLEF